MKRRDHLNLVLYFDKSASYQEELDEIMNQCTLLEKMDKIQFKAFERQGVAKSAKSIEDKIRALNPQHRGSIVATRGFPLPLSNSKKLNLSNTPILLVYSKDEKLAYVFPCLVGERYYSISDGIEHLGNYFPILVPLQWVAEDAITKRLMNNLPEIGLTLQAEEVETSAGRADIVFRDREGKHVIVEVEREATDNALGQILRLSAAYEKKFLLARDQVRAVIACIRIHEFVSLGAARAGIEIWKIPANEP